jgi:polysaccharide deacetylase 2 family uncharacterized protein YibQ
MSGNDLDAPFGGLPDSEVSRTGLVQDVPWSAIALSGMGLIAISLVAFVMVTDESLHPPRNFATLDPIITKRISVPALAPQASAAPHNPDETSTISRTIRTAASATIAPHVADDGGRTIVARAASQRRDAIAPGVTDEQASLAPAPDPRLLAPGPHGALPRIGRDGARPSLVYARAATTGAAGAPRVAIVVTGMGLDKAESERAADRLPRAVSFAFSPYGDNLDQQAEQARAAGHELLLQTPMEGAAGDRSAGPRTLAADAARERTLDALHWHMSRFSGYIGLTNLLGARFMAAPQAFSTVMQDMAERGLVFLDDGAAPKSLSSALAAAAGVQSARADVTIGGGDAPDKVDAGLRRLETLARERGASIGVIALGPQSVDRIRSFAQGLEARGVALAPVSALIEAPARTSAR